ncbi:MAG: 4-(cytidine 5'-diphospho)-2-C-methyl-D-erythritol kinase [Oscillospiraceae bacterium]|nr:4-(cytidine 5'-diphospho)-2-C-methyl-D-erythritol kinase [Oscillospiraceae bacterium]
MKSINEKAFAKINISLDVIGKRPDGYHEMLMVMQSVTLSDDVYVELCQGSEVTAQTNLRFIPCDDRNLAVRAAKVFFKAQGISDTGAFIRIKKNIPVGAGMAGGSSDAAAVLRALNTLYGKPYDRDGLEALAAGIGSDVAFCVSGGTVLATGRGEMLLPLPSLPDCNIVVCKPEFSISTPELFRKLDSVKLRCHPDSAGICEALINGDLSKLARRMYNVFEDVPDRRMSSISEIKNRMLDCGALGAIMTGTGSAVFGIFPDRQSAEATEKTLSAEYKSVFLTENKHHTEI